MNHLFYNRRELDSRGATTGSELCQVLGNVIIVKIQFPSRTSSLLDGTGDYLQIWQTSVHTGLDYLHNSADVKKVERKVPLKK